MKALILAAGMGSRLGKITGKIPKVLVDINGKTALQLAVEKCNASGFDDIIVNVHHLADMVEQEIDRLNQRGFKITVSDERERLLETGGALFKAKWFFDDKPFLVYNADIVTDFDLKLLFDDHFSDSRLATLVTRKRAGNRFFLTDKSGRVRGWRNNATGEEIIPDYDPAALTEIAFSGIHMVDPEIFRYMEEGIYTFTALYLKLVKDHKIMILRHDEGFWSDIGTPETLEAVRRRFSHLPESPGK
jgi:N-acetyl-alpha-D-muramate 1-phosphate uridylyltransferase